MNQRTDVFRDLGFCEARKEVVTDAACQVCWDGDPERRQKLTQMDRTCERAGCIFLHIEQPRRRKEADILRVICRDLPNAACWFIAREVFDVAALYPDEKTAKKLFELIQRWGS